jgi:putative transposase
MNYNYRYRLRPSDALEEQLVWTVDTCRQAYNHYLHRLNRNDDTSAYSEQKRFPDLKKWWNDLKQVHSKVLQKVVQRLYDNLSTLRGRKENGYRVGTLKWKASGEYHSTPIVNLASISRTRAVGRDCGSRNSEKSR